MRRNIFCPCRTFCPSPGLFIGEHRVLSTASINDFPVECPRDEGLVADAANPVAHFEAHAIVNRVDLIPDNGADCGAALDL
jgi:hypothetical protein